MLSPYLKCRYLCPKSAILSSEGQLVLHKFLRFLPMVDVYCNTYQYQWHHSCPSWMLKSCDQQSQAQCGESSVSDTAPSMATLGMPRTRWPGKTGPTGMPHLSETRQWWHSCGCPVMQGLLCMLLEWVPQGCMQTDLCRNKAWQQNSVPLTLNSYIMINWSNKHFITKISFERVPPLHFETRMGVSFLTFELSHLRNRQNVLIHAMPLSRSCQTPRFIYPSHENNSCGVTQQHNKLLSNGPVLSIMVHKQMVLICLEG